MRGFTWKNFTQEEQRKILAADRSNNFLETTKLSTLYPQVKNIKDSVRECLINYKNSMDEKTIKINLTKTSHTLTVLLSEIPDCKIEFEPEPIITINSSNSEVVLMNVLKILNPNNITINDLSAIPTNLEEIFLKVVSDSNERNN